MSELKITAELGFRKNLTERELDAPPELVFRAYAEPELLVQWLGPRKYTMTIDRFELPAHGGSWRYIHSDDEGNAWGFHGVFHGEPSLDGIVQTFEFEGAPGHVSLETATFEAHDGRQSVRPHQLGVPIGRSAGRDGPVGDGVGRNMVSRPVVSDAHGCDLCCYSDQVGDSDQPGKPNLAATSWALLGMLSYEHELSGYDIRKWSDWSMQFFYGSPAYSQIYSELKKLEQLGLVTSRVENSGGTRNRRLYKITASRPGRGHPMGERGAGRLADVEARSTAAGDARASDQPGQAERDPPGTRGLCRRDAAQGRQGRQVGGRGSVVGVRARRAAMGRAVLRQRARARLEDDQGTRRGGGRVPSGRRTADAKIPWPAPEYWYEIEKKADADD